LFKERAESLGLIIKRFTIKTEEVGESIFISSYLLCYVLVCMETNLCNGRIKEDFVRVFRLGTSPTWVPEFAL